MLLHPGKKSAHSVVTFFVAEPVPLIKAQAYNGLHIYTHMHDDYVTVKVYFSETVILFEP